MEKKNRPSADLDHDVLIFFTSFWNFWVKESPVETTMDFPKMVGVGVFWPFLFPEISALDIWVYLF